MTAWLSGGGSWDASLGQTAGGDKTVPGTRRGRQEDRETNTEGIH